MTASMKYNRRRAHQGTAPTETVLEGEKPHLTLYKNPNPEDAGLSDKKVRIRIHQEAKRSRSVR